MHTRFGRGMIYSIAALFALAVAAPISAFADENTQANDQSVVAAPASNSDPSVRDENQPAAQMHMGKKHKKKSKKSSKKRRKY